MDTTTTVSFEEALNILGLSPAQAYNLKGVEQAYRKQAKIHHPDRGGDSQKFKELHAAKETLLLTGGAAKRFPCHEECGLCTPVLRVGQGCCVRQVVVLSPRQSRAAVPMIAAVATDDGLYFIKQCTESPLDGQNRDAEPFTKLLKNISVTSCCFCTDESNNENLVFAGTEDGSVHCLDLLNKTVVAAYRITNARVISLSLARHQNSVLLAVACANRESTFLVRFDENNNFETLWKAPIGFIEPPETILLEMDETTARMWIGGFEPTLHEGTLLMYEVDIDLLVADDSNNSSGGEPEPYFWELSDSDENGDTFSDVPVIHERVSDKPVYAMDANDTNIFLIAGAEVIVWNRSSAQIERRLATNHNLYDVCVSPNEERLVACGDDGTIIVWSRGIVEFVLRVPTHRVCPLESNCVLSAAWVDDTMLLSGGYDGRVSLWRLGDASRDSFSYYDGVEMARA